MRNLAHQTLHAEVGVRNNAARDTIIQADFGAASEDSTGALTFNVTGQFTTGGGADSFIASGSFVKLIAT